METDGMTVIEHYGTIEAAQSQASYLVERGVGATVEPDDDPGAFTVAVLDDDADRAREVLGLVEAEPAEPTEIELIGAARPWLVPVLLLGLAMFIVPVLGFLVAFKLSGG